MVWLKTERIDNNAFADPLVWAKSCVGSSESLHQMSVSMSVTSDQPITTDYNYFQIIQIIYKL